MARSDEALEGTPGQLIAHLRKERKWSQTQLAELAHVSQQAVSKLERDIGGMDALFKVAGALDTPVEEIRSGRLSGESSNVREHVPVTRVPVFQMGEIVQNLRVQAQRQRATGQGEFTVIDSQTAQQAGAESFAIVIEGKSMEPIFRPGDTVIMSPESAPKPGDYVLVLWRNRSAREAANLPITAFGRYKLDTAGTDRILVCMENEYFPDLPIDKANPALIMGVAISHNRSLR